MSIASDTRVYRDLLVARSTAVKELKPVVKWIKSELSKSDNGRLRLRPAFLTRITKLIDIAGLEKASEIHHGEVKRRNDLVFGILKLALGDIICTEIGGDIEIMIPSTSYARPPTSFDVKVKAKSATPASKSKATTKGATKGKRKATTKKASVKRRAGKTNTPQSIPVAAASVDTATDTAISAAPEGDHNG